MDRLDRALRDFEDENSNLEVQERLSILRDALQWAAFDRMKRIQQAGKDSPEAIELNFKQAECQKQFKIMEQMFFSQLRQNKMLGKAQNEGMGRDFIKKVKEQKGYIGDIVRDLKPSDN